MQLFQVIKWEGDVACHANRNAHFIYMQEFFLTSVTTQPKPKVLSNNKWRELSVIGMLQHILHCPEM